MKRSDSWSMRTEHVQSAWEVFRVPVLLGAATAVGLLSALFGDGGWDALSWLALLVPVAAIGWAWQRAGRAATRNA